MKQPGGLCPTMDRLAGLSDEFPEDGFGQSPSGFAVAGGVGRDGGEIPIISIFLESVDGVVAGVVVGEDLGEEEAERDPRGIDPPTPAMVVSAASGLDASPGEMVEEGESFLAVEVLVKGIEWATRGDGDRLRHGDLLGWEEVGVKNHQATNPGGRFPGPRGPAT